MEIIIILQYLSWCRFYSCHIHVLCLRDNMICAVYVASFVAYAYKASCIVSKLLLFQ